LSIDRQKIQTRLQFRPMNFNFLVSRLKVPLCLICVLLAPLSAMADAGTSAEALKQKDYARARQECQAEAQAGDKDCQSTLGYLYRNGLGVTKDHAEAVRWLRKAAEQGQTSAEEMLGDSYRLGLGVGKDYAEALRLFNLSASKGSAWANNNLGNLYRYGQGVGRDAKEALRYYKLAADKGNPAGQTNLADLYRLGEGTERNPDLAFQFALKASKQNWPAGHNMLGLLFRDGLGVRQDTRQAIDLFKLAIEGKTVPIAHANLAGIYFNGTGVPVSLDEAAKWAQGGVQVNEPYALTTMSSIYRRGTKQIPANKERAFELTSKAAAMSHPAALNQLGFYYRDGIGVEIDYRKAADLLQQAISFGSADAIVNLAFMYEKGLGVAKDEAKALQDYERALLNPSLTRGTRSLAEASLASLKAPAALAATATTTTRLPQVQPVRAPGGDDDHELSRKELLERLEKMQQQLTSLQAASNSSALSSAVTAKQIVFAHRKALVIGNDLYSDVPKLANAAADAEAMAKALEAVGYKVTKHLNLDEKKFKQALREFRLQLQGGDEVLFFYAGHGIQLGNSNYLLPIDIKGDHEDQVKDEAILLQKVLDDLEDKKAKFALAVIDACRDNPFKGKGRAIGGRGLAPTTAATGQMIMFSAGSGQQALDKLGDADRDKNGLFTRVFVKEMMAPGVSVDRVLRNVRNEVVRQAKSVGHEQTPALYDQAIGEFYFRQ
jgi:TPR repeat protein